jgi:3-phenylpropionate/trans-cinnamate dioxygenase ferredoxin subunit
LHGDISQCPVCLVRAGGAVYALRGECTHQPAHLSDCEVTGGTIERWLHGSRSGLATDRVLSPPQPGPSPSSLSRSTAGSSSWRQ